MLTDAHLSEGLEGDLERGRVVNGSYYLLNLPNEILERDLCLKIIETHTLIVLHKFILFLNKNTVVYVKLHYFHEPDTVLGPSNARLK